MFDDGKILPLPAPPADGDLGPLPPSQVPETTEDNNPSDQDQPDPVPAPVATHTRTIGIIHPPPDIRSIVDKTSQFVARNGPDFEKRIIGNNAANAKFNFLNPSDPYHAYYQHRVAEFRAQADPSSQQQKTQSEASDPAPGTDPPAATRPDPASKFRPAKEVVLEPPEAEKYTVRLPEGITGEELEIIKLTAQFAAVNKKSNFAVGLANREMNNPQFHFLKPTHSMYSFFYALANAYSLVYDPPEGIRDELREKNLDMTTVLERCVRRLEWERSQEQARQKAEDEIEQERIQMAMIDWHDFVVVETIDFADDEDEDLPPPMSLEEVIRRSKVSSSATAEENDEELNGVEPSKEVEMDMDEEEAQLLEEGMRAAKLEESNEMVIVTGGEPDDEDVPRRIVKNWKRPEERIPAESDPTKYAVSPMSGELIPISHMSEHVRVSLIDPKFREQKERMFAKIRDTTLANDDEISRNIIGLARTRPDIFGTTEEEVSNAVKAEIEKKDEQPKQVIWDGHTGSIGRTANQAMSQNSLLVSAGDDLSGPAGPPPRPGILPVRPLPPPPGLALNLPRMPMSNMVQYPPPPVRPPPPMMPMMHMVPGQQQQQQQVFLANRPVSGPPGTQFQHFPVPPRPFVPMPAGTMMPPPPPLPLPHGMPPPPPEEAPPPLPEEPEPKRQKHDESLLVPEDQFLAQHPGPVRITVSVPNVDEGNLKGQFIEITVLSLSETVGSLKEKIAGEIQLPANKQKLSGKPGFLKDNMSLAYYNVGAGEALALSLRERGGRKR